MLEKETRLFYVALTRGLEELNLITVKNNESQFIDEIPWRYFTSSRVKIVDVNRY